MFDRCSGKNEEIACVALTDPPLLKPDHHQCSFIVMVIDRVIDGSPAHSHHDNHHHHHGEVYCLNSMVGGLSGEYSKAWFKPTHFGSLGRNFFFGILYNGEGVHIGGEACPFIIVSVKINTAEKILRMMTSESNLPPIQVRVCFPSKWNFPEKKIK